MTDLYVLFDDNGAAIGQPTHSCFELLTGPLIIRILG
tara:strand:- start:171 stop:281 length:111 start_codon:yes stop_codon:yes gene_type:complete